MKLHKAQSAAHPREGGAVIVVVLSLMTTLIFLGLFFFGWSSQEVANAELFAAPDDEKLPLIDPLPHLERAAEQLIVGTRYGYEASALWGGMHSMLANKIGRITPELTPTDTNVATGTGIQIRYVDSNNDGKPDDDADTNPEKVLFVYRDAEGNEISRDLDNLVINYSPLAQPDRTTDAFNQPDNAERIPLYRPDVDYTYPDINSLFLAHDEESPPGSPGARVLIPSFFRPQIYLGLRADGSFADLTTEPGYQRQTLSPHREHRYANGDLRYLAADFTPAQSGDKSRSLKKFPFPDSGAFGIFTDPGAPDNYELLKEYAVPTEEKPLLGLENAGTPDAILMDLGLPMLTLPGGQQFVPLASFKVIDADGLLNLNAHGNLQGAQHLARSEDSDDPVSVSNLGMSRSEVNPVWALDGDISTLTTTELEEALKHIQSRFGPAGIAAANAAHKLGNMELFMLLTGYQPDSNSEATPGRHGDTAQVREGLPALGGVPGNDDDEDGQADGGYGQLKSSTADLLGLTVRGFVHPLAPTGLGLPGFSTANVTGSPPYYLTFDNTRGAFRTLETPIEKNPAAFPFYRNFQQLSDSPMSAALPDLLSRRDSTLGNELLDEEDETILEPGHLEYGLHDLPFGASENAALHLSADDLSEQPVSSRAKTLAAANFVHVDNSEQIRKRFTTDSWDRLEFNITPNPDRDWELGTNSEFPPTVAVSGTQVQPFRQELMDLLRTPVVGTDEFGVKRSSPRHRLNINKILSNDRRSDNSAQEAFVNGSPRFRDLVPHPLSLNGGTLSHLQQPMHHSDNVEPVPFNLIGSDVCAQEWWARYDRQRLARDIYTLLWTVGFAENPAMIAIPERERQAREMAQFAVNVVDAMDPDNVITEFQYDANLLDGWDTDIANLKMVYGVEHQELTISEVLFIRSLANKDDDLPETEYDDEESTNQYHAFIELRNAAPWDVSISNSEWRLRRVNDSDGTIYSVILKDSNREAIEAGAQYLIASQGGLSRFPEDAGERPYRPSDFRFDHDGNETYDLICPNVYEANVPSKTTADDEDQWEPRSDLDLVYEDHNNRFQVQGDPSTLFWNLSNEDAQTEVRILLERRLRPDPSGTVTDDALNPWVEVDRIAANIQVFDPESGIDGLKNLKSFERRHPFDPEAVPFTVDNEDARAIRGMHTMPYLDPQLSNQDPEEKDLRNSNSPESFPVYQPHFDRDFSSVMELLSVPLYGYRESVEDAWSASINGGPVRNLVLQTSPTKMPGHRSAAARFLYPQDASTPAMPLPAWLPAAPGDAPHYANRWYRLLELLEVKSQDQLRSEPLTSVTRRTPGKINLNTIRNEQVFAGLIDDPYHLNPAVNPDAPTTDRFEGADRNWYYEHRLLRDGRDPLLEGSGPAIALIPGNLNSRPFRSLSYLENSIDGGPAGADALSIESTILRRRDLRGASPTTFTDTFGHGLYDAVPLNVLDDFDIDYHTKNRILAKIHNNSTTRSHIFFAWIGVQFFEAHVNENNLIQIGGKSKDLPDLYRMFCVIDMSRLEEAYNPETGAFEFRKFIIYQQLLP